MALQVDHVVPVIFMEGGTRDFMRKPRQGYLGVGTDPEHPDVAYFGEVYNVDPENPTDPANTYFTQRRYYLDEYFHLDEIATEGLVLDSGSSRNRLEVPPDQIQLALRTLPRPLNQLGAGDRVRVERNPEHPAWRERWENDYGEPMSTLPADFEQVFGEGIQIRDVDSRGRLRAVGFEYDPVTGLQAGSGATRIFSDTALDGSTISVNEFEKEQQARYAFLRERMSVILNPTPSGHRLVPVKQIDHHTAQLATLDEWSQPTGALTGEHLARGVKYLDKTLTRYDPMYQRVKVFETDVTLAERALKRAAGDLSGATTWSREVVIPAHSDETRNQPSLAISARDTGISVANSTIAKAKYAIPFGHAMLLPGHGGAGEVWAEARQDLYLLLQLEHLSTGSALLPQVLSPIHEYVLDVRADMGRELAEREESTHVVSETRSAMSPEHAARIAAVLGKPQTTAETDHSAAQQLG